MYQYFFEGDIVRLAYWRIDYDDNKTMYANTSEDKLGIVAKLTEQGFTPTVSAIDQTGNEWIDGMCFTDHSTVDVALAAGCKDFMCDGDMSAIVDTLTTMNDGMFHVDSDNVWHITLPSVPSFSCYNTMVCVTTSSVNNQMVSINNDEPIPLMKNSTDPVMAYDINVPYGSKLAMQINVVDGKAYINSGTSDGWQLGELKTFGYMRNVPSELLCDGNAFDKNAYPELYNLIKDTYAIPADYVVVSGEKDYCITHTGNALYIPGHHCIMKSIDGGVTWSTVYEVPSNVSGCFMLPILAAGGVLYGGYYDINSSSTHIVYSLNNGASWTKLSITANFKAGCYTVSYAQERGEWILCTSNSSEGVYVSTNGVDFSKKYQLDNHSICPIVAYLSDTAKWLFVTYSYTGECVISTSESASTKPTRAYSLTGYVLDVADDNDDYYRCGSVTTGNSLILTLYNSDDTTKTYACVLSDTDYNLIALPSTLSLSNIVYATDIDSVICLAPEGLVSIDVENMLCKKYQQHTGTVKEIRAATYDAANTRIIFSGRDDITAGLFTVDACNTALPTCDNFGYTYIKAK